MSLSIVRRLYRSRQQPPKPGNRGLSLSYLHCRKWTHAAVPDAIVTPELSVTVDTDWEKPLMRECFRNHNNLPKREVRKESLLQFAFFQGGRQKHELEQNRNTTIPFLAPGDGRARYGTLMMICSIGSSPSHTARPRTTDH